MRLRLVLLSVATTALYLLLAVRSDVAATERVVSRWYRPSLFEASVEFYGIWLALFILYAVAVRLVRSRSDRGVVTIVLVTSAAFRAALFLGNGFDLSPPGVFLHGPSPLSWLFDRLTLSDTVQRMAVSLADLGALALAPALLRAARIPTGAMVLHGWNPLVVKEAAGSGRLWILALFGLVLAFRLVQKGSRWAAALVYGASLNGPLLLAATLPLMARALAARVVLALGVALVGWMSAFPGESWAARALWPPESTVGGSLTPAMIAIAGLLVTRNPLVPIGAMCLAWGSVVATRASRWSRDHRVPAETLIAIGGLSFVAPAVLPWAFVALAYFAAHSRNPGWLAFTATAPVSYLAIELGGWSFWLAFAQYFFPYALSIHCWLGRPPPEAAGLPPSRPRARGK